MNESHLAYLNLGSNIQPTLHLVQAVELLREQGEVLSVSNAWESKSVGADGPNYLNACVLLKTNLTQTELKENILHPIESALGRKRTENKFAPRTMDIDTVLFDDILCDEKFLRQAFVVVPLAEIYPRYKNSIKCETIIETATRLRSEVWMEARPEVLSPFR